jgi:hypothetical protein
MYSIDRTDRDPSLEPGEVVWANVLNPQENARCRGKSRPVILIHPNRAGWRVMGLTTNPTFGDGKPRTAIEDPAALGLSGRSFLWGSTTDVCRIDLLDHIGWIDEPTAHELAGHPHVHCTAATLLGQDGPDLTTAA